MPLEAENVGGRLDGSCEEFASTLGGRPGLFTELPFVSLTEDGGGKYSSPGPSKREGEGQGIYCVTSSPGNTVGRVGGGGGEAITVESTRQTVWMRSFMPRVPLVPLISLQQPTNSYITAR